MTRRETRQDFEPGILGQYVSVRERFQMET
jgi:hypothetical protein